MGGFKCLAGLGVLLLALEAALAAAHLDHAHPSTSRAEDTIHGRRLAASKPIVRGTPQCGVNKPCNGGCICASPTYTCVGGTCRTVCNNGVPCKNCFCPTGTHKCDGTTSGVCKLICASGGKCGSSGGNCVCPDGQACDANINMCKPVCSDGQSCGDTCTCAASKTCYGSVCGQGTCQASFEKATNFLRDYNNYIAKAAQGDKPGQGWDIIFYGDSITERLNGDYPSVGPAYKEVWTRNMASKYRAVTMGVQLDRTAQLLWRLKNGNIPKVNFPKVVVTLIGTNDLGDSPGAVDSVMFRYNAIVKYLLDKLPGTQVATVGILPRGYHSAKQPSMYTASINAINQRLSEMAQCNERVHYIGCAGQTLLLPSGDINGTLIPDGVHPSPPGWDNMFQRCLNAEIAKLMIAHQCQGGSNDACTTQDNKAGHCSGGLCKVTCDPATNCMAPCGSCDTSTDTCVPQSGSCSGGVCDTGMCKARCNTNDPCTSSCACTDTHACAAGICKATFEKPTLFPGAHNQLVSEVKAADGAEGWDVVFYGDTVIERLRGTQNGGVLQLPGFKDVWSRYMGSLRAAALGISGDRSTNLMWRLSNGELPAKAPKLVFVEIGMNDIGAVGITNPNAGDADYLAEADPTAARVEIMVKFLLQRLPDTQVVLLGLLPKGRGSFLQPSNFTAAHNRLNSNYGVLADKYDRLHYVGCGSAALLTAAGNINTTLMPDASFPSPAGYDRLFSQCWGPAIGQLLASQQCQNPVSTAPCITAQFQRGHCVAGACQVTCNPATNCQGPCRQCDTSSDTCQELDPTQTCTTAGSAAGHCAAGGDCKVTCDPATNCQGPCNVCNTEKDVCEPAAGPLPCTLATGEPAACRTGTCKALCTTNDPCSASCYCPEDTHACSAASGAGICKATFVTPTLNGQAFRQLVSEVQAADAGQGWDVMFLGDQLVERMRGTTNGGFTQLSGYKDVFQNYMGSKYKAAALGISSDRSQQLLWDLLNGEVPKVKIPRLVVLSTGTNDLGLLANETAVLAEAEPLAKRVEVIVRYLLAKLPSSDLLLLGLLPRGKNGHLQPSMYTAGINKANNLYKAIVDRYTRVHFADCAGPLLLTPSGGLNSTLVPDATNPSPPGMDKLFAQCWAPAVAALLPPTQQ